MRRSASPFRIASSASPLSLSEAMVRMSYSAPADARNVSKLSGSFCIQTMALCSSISDCIWPARLLMIVSRTTMIRTGRRKTEKTIFLSFSILAISLPNICLIPFSIYMTPFRAE